VGAATHVKFRVLPFRVKIQDLALVVPGNDLTEDIFLRAGKPKIFDQATTALVHRFYLGGVAFGETEVQVLSSWWMYCCC
jgi:hypothetical protein